MSSRLFKLVINVNKILGIAPPPRKQDMITKLYSLLIVSLLTVGVITSSRDRGYLKSYTHIKFVISVLMDVIAYVFNCYVTLSMTFWREKQWKELIKAIKPSTIPNTKIPYYLGFLMLNIFFWIIVSCSNYAFNQIVVFKTAQDIAVLDTELYTQFLFGYLIYVTSDMLLSRYRYLTYLLSDYVQNVVPTKSRSGEEFTYFMRKIEHIAYVLKEATDNFNAIFGIPLLLTISYSTLHFVNYVDDIFFFRFDPVKFSQFVVSNICLVFMIFVSEGKFFCQYFVKYIVSDWQLCIDF